MSEQHVGTGASVSQYQTPGWPRSTIIVQLSHGATSRHKQPTFALVMPAPTATGHHDHPFSRTRPFATPASVEQLACGKCVCPFLLLLLLQYIDTMRWRPRPKGHSGSCTSLAVATWHSWYKNGVSLQTGIIRFTCIRAATNPMQPLVCVLDGQRFTPATRGGAGAAAAAAGTRSTTCWQAGATAHS